MPQYVLRPYQKEAVDIAIQWVLKNSDPALLEISGGAGKSLICAEIARIIYQKTKKRILVLVPNQDLLIQNGEKMELTGEKFSFYSASVGKSLRHHIVLATEGTFKSIAKERGHEFALVIVDEAHRVTPTFKQIIDDMREGNPLLRVVGMTGTPFRSTGYIYELDMDNRIVSESYEPYYKKLLYRLTCNELITMGYLTPVVIGVQGATYDTSKIGDVQGDDFTESQQKKVFECQTVTQKIVQDIIDKAKNQRGVIIFCATLKHAEEVMSLLPEGKACFLHGGLKKAERRQMVKDYKDQKYKYLVNRDIASTGFDAPHSDTCVFMRAIGSNGLFQQMVWRVVRLFFGKDESLILDYGNNIQNLFDGSDDIFTPNIKAYGKKENEQIEVACPECGTQQNFSKRNGYETWDEFGYATDLAGDKLGTDGHFIPAHYGRRCTHKNPIGKNQYERCSYWWAHKECPACQHKNDVAARECENCGFSLINPDEKLTDTAIVIPVGEKFSVRVNGMEVKKSSDGAVAYVTFDTQHGDIKCRFFPTHAKTHIARHWWAFKRSTEDSTIIPKYIEYTRQESGYCSINRYMREGLAG